MKNKCKHEECEALMIIECCKCKAHWLTKIKKGKVHKTWVLPKKKDK